MQLRNLFVTKASGERELFSEKKVRRSLRRADVPKKLENLAIRHVYKKLYDGITTKEVYDHISEFLGSSKYPHTKAQYSLKHAIMQLGPSGFPFEKFIAKVLENHRYKVQTNIIYPGKCVEHEIDVIAEKDNSKYILECKFHNRPGARSDIKVALYVHSRFEDIQNSEKSSFSQAWLVTNTKTTTEAIKYSECVGMRVIAWSHPRSGSLQEFVEDAGLHPITSLSSLSEQHKRQILGNNIVLCKDLALEKNRHLIPKNVVSEVLAEISAICRKK